MEHKLKGTLSPVKTLKGALSLKHSNQIPYGGPYEVIPRPRQQVLSTKGKTLDGDIIVHPIPNNYGLVIWDGAVLTIS